MRPSQLLTLLACLALPLAACDDLTTPAEPPTPGEDDDDPADLTSLVLDVDGLPTLGEAAVYEGWLIVDGSPVSTGRFTVAEGEEGTQVFEVTTQDADAAELFVLTIEPAVGDDPAPSETHLLAGEVDSDGLANAVLDHPAALGTDFSDAAGSYILMTPTSADVPEDYAQGLWWLDPEGDHAPALELPELPQGWVYEGWVVTDDGPISTGRFTEVDAADFDGAGPEAGPDGAPPFPGQDFIEPSLDLVGLTTVISVEPQPDDSPAPFALKPLIDPTVEDVGPGVLQGMDNTSAPIVSAVSLGGDPTM